MASETWKWRALGHDLSGLVPHLTILAVFMMALASNVLTPALDVSTRTLDVTTQTVDMPTPDPDPRTHQSRMTTRRARRQTRSQFCHSIAIETHVDGGPSSHGDFGANGVASSRRQGIRLAEIM